jgi:hypothetical protein
VTAHFYGTDILWQTSLDGGPVLAAAGKISADNYDIAAALGRMVYLYTPADSVYSRIAAAGAEQEVLSLAVGLPVGGRDSILLGLSDSIIMLGFRQGSLQLLSRSDPESGALFTDLAAGELIGNGPLEVVAAASGTDNIYVYSLEGQEGNLRLELVGIRSVPGRPVQVEIFRSFRGPGIAVLYRVAELHGLATYFLTERGFAEGPVLEGLPGSPGLLAAGDFTQAPEQELALGGSDGRVRIIAVTENELQPILTTSVLGADVSALTPGGEFGLAAGTPGGYVFIFNFPVRQEPDRAVHNSEPVYSLAEAGPGRLAAGAGNGILQVIGLGGGAGGVSYTVRTGDTLWLIAKRFGTTAMNIMAVNNISEPGLIYPGRVLIIPIS